MRIFFTIGLLFLSLTFQAQDLKSLYTAIPDSLSPLLTKVNRQDFGDFLSSKMKAEVQNRFGKKSEMTQLTDDYLELKLTSVSRVEMKLLPVNDSTQVICVAKTYNGPVADTELAFYSTSWEKLPTADFIELPQKDDYFILPTSPEKTDSLNHLKAQADMHLQKAKLSDQSQTLQFTYTVPDYLEKTTAETIQAYLKKSPLCYEWKAGRFVRKN